MAYREDKTWYDNGKTHEQDFFLWDTQQEYFLCVYTKDNFLIPAKTNSQYGDHDWHKNLLLGEPELIQWSCIPNGCNPSSHNFVGCFIIRQQNRGKQWQCNYLLAWTHILKTGVVHRGWSVPYKIRLLWDKMGKLRDAGSP